MQLSFAHGWLVFPLFLVVRSLTSSLMVGQGGVLFLSSSKKEVVTYVFPENVGVVGVSALRWPCCSSLFVRADVEEE